MTKLGIFSLLAGVTMWIFSAISGLMEAQNFWVDLSISKIIGADNSEAFITLTDNVFVQNKLDFLMYDLPFSAFLMGLGAIFLIISLFVKNH